MKKIFIYGDREKLKNYVEAVEGVGGEAVTSGDISGLDGCGALLLPGGGDVDPAAYGKENAGSFGINVERDDAEKAMIKAALEAGKPVLGICRGIQIINVALGGTLVQDLPTSDKHRWDENSGDRVHGITADDGGFLYPIYGGEFTVNSAHHQAIEVLAPGLTPVAFSSEGVIEAVQDEGRRIYAVQFHPERMSFAHRREDAVDGKAIFEFFMSVI